MVKLKNTIPAIRFLLGNKEVLWISDINKYIVAEPWIVHVIHELIKGTNQKQIASHIALEIDLSKTVTLDLVRKINRIWKENTSKNTIEANFQNIREESEINLFSKRKYETNEVVIEVEYETANAEWYIHPKFAFMEVPATKEPKHRFRVADSDGLLTLWVNGEHCGSWPKTENHFLSGKFSMQIIQKIYGKDENEWMGIFHAAGISNRKQCLMFFGDSGNGKSTLSALLMAAGFDVLSDDFLPVESATGLVFRFPAALSIKKQAFELIQSFYPELCNSEEYENLAFQKTYRFLPQKNNTFTGVPCKAIILVKYDPSVKFRLEKMAPEHSFARFVPDSWINQKEGNPGRFLEWFANQEHYQLSYSDNEMMIKTIKEMLDNE